MNRTSATGPTLKSDLLAGSVALVTGGAQGIGRATVETLVANGASVCIADLDPDKSAEVTRELGGKVTSYVGDLTEPGVPARVVAHAVEAFGCLDIVVNNAGFFWDALVHQMTDEQWQALIDIHLTVPFAICRAAYPHMCVDDGPGVRKVVMVSSVAAALGTPGAANYVAAKAGQLGLMRTLANEWGPHGVTVNAVAFGPMATRLMDSDGAIDVGGRTIQSLPPEVLARAKESTALGRAGSPQEAADAIFWLCSPLSDYMSGQVVTIDGGSHSAYWPPGWSPAGDG